MSTYAADYIVLADGALFRVGLEEVDFAQELVLVVFELPDHDGRCGVWYANAIQMRLPVCKDSDACLARAEIISAMLRDAGRGRSSDRAASPPSHQTSHRCPPCLFCFRLIAGYLSS